MLNQLPVFYCTLSQTLWRLANQCGRAELVIYNCSFSIPSNHITGSMAISPTNVSGVLPETVLHTPSVSGRSKQCSSDFAEKIRQLEIEGDKLREVTAASLSQFGGPTSGADGIDSSFEAGKHVSAIPPVSLSSLVDISTEQKTISDLRVQLEQQRKETERLQAHLLNDLPPSRSLQGASVSPSPTKSAFSTLPSNELATSRRAFEFVPPSHLERALKESQEQVTDLRKRLQETTDTSESQKRQFRANIEELKSKLHETIINRDAVLELRQKESTNQESLISKLQATIQHQQERIKTQEQVLADANKKLETFNQSSYVTETTLNQVKTFLAEKEKRRGKPFFETEPAINQGSALIIHTLERCFQEMERDLELKSNRLIELEAELNDLKASSSEKEQTLNREYQEWCVTAVCLNLQKETEESLRRVTQVTSDHERQIEAASERATNARKQAATLQNQLQILESQHEQQLKLKNSIISELESKVRDMKEDYNDDRTKWQERREALQSSLDQVQRELTTARLERDEAVRKHAAMETRIEDYQGSVSRLESDLETERNRGRKQREREEDLRSKLMSTENNLVHKQQDVERLEKMLDVVKQECSNQMQSRVASAEKLERDRHTDQIESLTSQLNTMMEKCNKVTVELEITKTELNSFKQQVSDLTEKLETARIQLEAAMSEKRHLSDVLNDRKVDVDRLSKERDYYFNLLEQRNEEISQIKSLREKLSIQLDEKEKNMFALKQQSENISQLVEVNSKTSENIREEKERLMFLLNEKTVILEELRTGQETMTKKLKLREKRLKDLEEERLKFSEELAVKVQEMDLVQQEKENLFRELKESRVEVANLTDAKDKIKKEVGKLKTVHEKEISKLQSKLKGADYDLKLAQKTLRSKDSVDNKAVRYADKMQKEITNKRGEVDTLQSKVRKLEDKLQTVFQEKTMVERDKESLKKSLTKCLLHTQHLTSELEKYQTRNQVLQDLNAQLEATLEKAATKTASSQVHLEQFEQEIARLKIKHQLDLKEAEQSAQAIKTTLGIQSSLAIKPRYDNPVYTPVVEDDIGSCKKPQTQPRDSLSDHPVTSRHDSSKPGVEFGPNKETSQGYHEVGQELKKLLTEMRSLIAGQREITQKSKHKPLYHSSPFRTRNERQKSSSPDQDSLSDSEMDHSWARSRSRSRSHIGDFSSFSSVRGCNSMSRSLGPHCRSYSAEVEYTPKSLHLSHSRIPDISHLSALSLASSTGRGLYAGSPVRTRDDVFSPKPATLQPGTDPNPDTFSPLCTNLSPVSPACSLPGTPFSLSPVNTDLTVDSHSPGFWEEDGSCSVPLMPDTQELCKRLEEKIENLTKMGGNLQKENREMADLINIQGKKIQMVRENERKVRKTPR